MHSLASENLQELENLVGSARQKQEEIVVGALGSLYGVKYYIHYLTWDLQGIFSAGLDTVRVSRYSLRVLADSHS